MTAASTPGAIGRTPRQVAGPEVDRLRESEGPDHEPDAELTAPAERTADDAVDDGGVDGPETDGTETLDPDPEPVAMEPDLDPEPEADPEVEPDTEPVAMEPDPDPEPVAMEPDPEPVAMEPDPDPEPEVEPDTESAVASDPVPEPDTEPVAATDLDPDVTPAGFMVEPDELRRRWESVQASFVDDPRRAVEQADGMVSAAVAALQAHIEQRREDLAETWRDGEQASTDTLLTAFQRYRDLFDGVLST